MADREFPKERFERCLPEESGFDAAKLAAAGEWFCDQAGDEQARAMVLRGGKVVGEWYNNCDAEQQVWQASAGKSTYSCMLGIAVDEGVIKSADDLVVDYYPEMMCVPEGFGPKPGRFAREKDAGITFRQLISNTSGYLKPDEEPGKVFHYQTYGMNILCHAIATAYGYYDSRAPGELPGWGKLAKEKIRDRIGATWSRDVVNFDSPRTARLNIFGNSQRLVMTAEDMARLGWLWLNEGRWEDSQVVPAEWIRQARKVSADLRANEPEEKWAYGHGFWTNEFGKLWPGLPRDCYTAWGAGRILNIVCPSLDLVVVEAPGLFKEKEDENAGLLARIIGACKA